MNFSVGNIVIIIAIVLAIGMMLWQIMSSKPPSDSSLDDSSWYDEVDDAEERFDESEEFLRRMERLSKRNDDKNDKK